MSNFTSKKNAPVKGEINAPKAVINKVLAYSKALHAVEVEGGKRKELIVLN